MLRLLLTGIACALLLACASQPPAAEPDQPPEAAAAPAPPPPPERAIPDDSVYPLLLAEFALRRGDFEVALEQYSAQAPLLRDPGVSAHTTHLAQYLAREQEALEAAQLWVELEPGNLEANNTLAILLIRQGRNVQALPHLALLAREGEEVNFPTVLNDFEQLSPTDRAELSRGVERLAQEMPDNTQVLLTQAMIQAETRQFEASLGTLNQVFALEADQKQAALLEAKILMAQGSPQPFARLERMLAANPEDTQVRMQYARMLTATDLAAAQEQFEVLSTQAPRNGELLLSLALLNRETGDNVAARNYLRQLLALEQHVDEAHYYLGRIAEDDGDKQSAIYEYKQVEEGREFVAANGRLGLIYISGGQLDEYRAHFDQLRRNYPERAEQLYGVEADLLARENEVATALAVINEALLQMPDSTALRYARAMLAEEQGDLALLESDLRRIIAEEPDNATAMNALGYTLANRTRRYDEAYRLISQALALQPNEPAILDSMGWVLYRMNRNEEALDYLTRAYAAFPDPEVAAHLGEVLWVSGDTDRAVQVWQGALLKDPDNVVLVETLQRLEITGLQLPALDERPDTGSDDAQH
jgi:Flp pilus assembly protein TadD